VSITGPGNDKQIMSLVMLCGRYCLWPKWSWPMWFVADVVVADMVEPQLEWGS